MVAELNDEVSPSVSILSSRFSSPPKMGGKRSAKAAFNVCPDLKDLGLYPHMTAAGTQRNRPGAAF